MFVLCFTSLLPESAYCIGVFGFSGGAVWTTLNYKLLSDMFNLTKPPVNLVPKGELDVDKVNISMEGGRPLLSSDGLIQGIEAVDSVTSEATMSGVSNKFMRVKIIIREFSS